MPGSRRHSVRSAFLSIAALVLSAAVIPARARAQGPNDHTAADVAFVQGMIAHHAQAVVMSDWAPTHGASPAVATLCKRIALSQRDEIHMMQQWLQERHLPTPDPLHMLHGDSAASHAAAMHGTSTHGMQMSGDSTMAMMPGMLTPAQLRALDAARGPEFDRLYLTGMIRHHEGALRMVADLFATPGSGQQADLFGFATDVDAGQRAEIGRMEALLDTLTPSPTR